MIAAVSAGRVGEVRRILESRRSARALQERGPLDETALHAACAGGQTEAAPLLLQTSPSANSVAATVRQASHSVASPRDRTSTRLNSSH